VKLRRFQVFRVAGLRISASSGSQYWVTFRLRDLSGT
jgi:hypothetical protein